MQQVADMTCYKEKFNHLVRVGDADRLRVEIDWEVYETEGKAFDEDQDEIHELADHAFNDLRTDIERHFIKDGVVRF